MKLERCSSVPCPVIAGLRGHVVSTVKAGCRGRRRRIPAVCKSKVRPEVTVCLEYSTRMALESGFTEMNTFL